MLLDQDETDVREVDRTEILNNLGAAVADFLTAGLRDLSPGATDKLANGLGHGKLRLCLAIQPDDPILVIVYARRTDGRGEAVELFRVTGKVGTLN